MTAEPALRKIGDFTDESGYFRLVSRVRQRTGWLDLPRRPSVTNGNSYWSEIVTCISRFLSCFVQTRLISSGASRPASLRPTGIEGWTGKHNRSPGTTQWPPQAPP